MTDNGPNPAHIFDGTADSICVRCGRCRSPECPSGVCREWRDKCAEHDR